LKPDAIPSLFPNCPSYLSTVKAEERSECTSFASRFQSDQARQEDINQKFLDQDKLESLEDVKRLVKVEKIPSGITVIEEEKSVKFISLTNSLYSLFGLSVFEDLSCHVSVHGKIVDLSVVSHIVKDKLSHFNQVSNILAHLREISRSTKSVCNGLVHSLETVVAKEENDIIKRKLSFLLEQVALTTSKKKNYSADLLSLSVLWEKTSPALYKSMLKENLITLPSVRHLQRLSSAISVETGFDEKSIAYIKTRTKSLTDKEKNIILIGDEIHTAKRAEYFQGKLYGQEDGKTTKSMMCWMVKSICSPFCDVICLTPTVNITAKQIKDQHDSIIPALKECQLNVLATVLDNYAPNRKFFLEELCGGQLKTSVIHSETGNQHFLLFDSVHNFKNIYGNFVNKREFECPKFKDEEIGSPKFKHLEELYLLEMDKNVRISHKLNDRVLHPTLLERTNVSLSNALFHESTIQGLEFYGKNGHEEFLETVPFLKLIRKMWNICNVRTPKIGIMKREPSLRPVTQDLRQNLTFLKDFSTWIDDWKGYSEKSLTKETTLAVKQTCKGLSEVMEYLLDEKDFKYVLSGQFQSDPIEKRFGYYRQLCGSNYFVSVRQILESEKGIRMKALVKHNNLNLAEIKEAFEDYDMKDEEAEEIGQELLDSFGIEDIDCQCTKEEENILYYISGYIARRLRKDSQNCDECLSFITTNRKMPDIEFEKGENDIEEQRHRDFLESINRGGLCSPSDSVYQATIFAWKLFQCLTEDKDCRLKFFQCQNPIKVFKATFEFMIENDAEFCHLSGFLCSKHDFTPNLKKIAQTVMNVCCKNFASKINSQIHKERKRGSSGGQGVSVSSSSRKIKKLQSN